MTHGCTYNGKKHYNKSSPILLSLSTHIYPNVLTLLYYYVYMISLFLIIIPNFDPSTYIVQGIYCMFVISTFELNYTKWQTLYGRQKKRVISMKLILWTCGNLICTTTCMRAYVYLCFMQHESLWKLLHNNWSLREMLVYAHRLTKNILNIFVYVWIYMILRGRTLLINDDLEIKKN